MYGRVHRSSKSCRSLGRSYSQHMRSVPPSETTKNTLALPGDNHSNRADSVITASSIDSFSKDGRKISVGDCALFKPPNDSPPLIGLIRWLALNKENTLQIGLNWLYRSSELKLEKGTLVDSAPNEIFYSFQKDEVPAASLLHPCKVAFLPKGVELPTGKSSFICRRAYDNRNKSLWWLTDRNYINDQQEEVAHLLYKTRTEMHVTLHPDARSPTQNNGPTLTSQPKPASDSGQNSGNSGPTQPKGKKRERGDHGGDHVKRGRVTRPDEGDSVQCKTERNLKHEIAKITEKGGVMDMEGVEKLVQLMQPDKKEKKMDLGSRSMLASVLASTENVDCLNGFVQLRGLPVLDGWLQDIHKGKLGDGNNLKDGDKSVDEFLLVLLRALDKLPVNLQALQMCNIGRSVNHLRSHKNTDIHRKARILVDTWKKRVEAEMISIDATKTGSTQAVSVWQSKSRLPEASHGSGSRTSDGAMKASTPQNYSAKTTPGRSSPGESSLKYETSSPGPVKPASTTASGKESQPRSSGGGTTDATQIRDDRSSSSNQSHNNGQPFPVKNGLKSSTSGSVAVSKISSSTARNRKNGFPLTSATGQKETSSSKISPAQNSTALEKFSHCALSGERVVEGPISEGTSQKLIVKIPNIVRSPAQGVSGSSVEDSNIMSSRASSPVILNKHEQADYASNGRSVASQRGIESQNSDPKDVLTGSEGLRSPAVLPDEDRSMKMKTAHSKRSVESPATDQLKLVKLQSSSFSPMNALVESCAKYSEATSSLSLDDDVGMNLLASVAAGETCGSDMVSPTDSTERTTPAVEEVCSVDEDKSRSTPGDCPKEAKNSMCNDGECDGNKHAILDGCPGSDDKPPVGKNSKEVNSIELRCNADPKWKITEKSTDTTSMTSKALSVSTEKVKDSESNGGMHEEEATCGNAIADGVSDCKKGGTDVMVSEEKSNTDHLRIGEYKPVVDHSGTTPIEGDFKKFENETSNKAISHPKLSVAIVETEFTIKSPSDNDLSQSECGQNLLLEAGGSVKVEEPEDNDAKSCMNKSDRLNSGKDLKRIATLSRASSHDLNSPSGVAEVENQEIAQRLIPNRQCRSSVKHEAQEDELTGSRSSSIRPDETEKCSSSRSGETDPCERMKFDLNESFSDDDGKYGEPVNLSSTFPVVNPLPFPVNSITGGHSASITVASAAVRPFVPPEDLLRSKVELGWNGSASTSAFRPAEPRKIVEMALGPSDSSCPDASTSKSNRFPLDIDLNVTDERVFDEIASRGSVLAVESTDLASTYATLQTSTSMSLRGFGGLDLDLNLVGETNDTGHCVEASTVDVKPVTNLHIQRDFDLNDGPVVDDASVRQFQINQLVKGGVVPSQLPTAGLAVNNQGSGPSSFASWFSPGNTYSTIAIPSVLPDRGEQQPFPVFQPGSAPQRPFGVAQFNPDMYRGSVLSSSPAVPFPLSHFQYPVFPFGTTFPLPSGTFPAPPIPYPDSSSGARIFSPPLNSQYLGPVGNVGSQFQRSYMVGPPGVSNNGGLDSNRKWIRQGLDLNSGPGNMESEVKEDMLTYSSGQHSAASFQAIAEEQARMFSVSGGVLKRREPEGGQDNDTARHRHPSWQ